MKSMFRVFGVSVLALAFAFSGCGDKGKSGSGSGSESGSGSKSDGGSGAPTQAVFKPMVGQDAKYVLGVNLEKEQTFKVVDACIDELVKALRDEMSKSPEFDAEREAELTAKIAEINRQVAACKEDPFKNAPTDLRALLDKSGLRNPEIYWGALALEDFKVEGKQPQFKGLSLSIAGKVDLEKLISALQGECGDVLAFEKTMLEGEKAWHVVSPDPRVVMGLRKAHIDPYVTSLDGQLLLVAASRETLAKQILLYRKGERRGDSLHGFSAAGGEFARLHLSDVGDLLRQYVPPRKLNNLPPNFENGKEILLGLKDLVVDVRVGSNGSLQGAIQLGTASGKDADRLRTFAKDMLKIADQAPNVPAAAKRVLQSLKVGGAQDRLEIRNVDMFALTIGAMVPAVTSAMLNAKTSAMAMQGRKLIMGIIMANIDRQGKADPVWPRERDENSSDEGEQDIAAKCGSATEYFNALFDMEGGNYGTSKWDPALDGELLSCLWGFGVPGMTGTKLMPKNIAWNIAVNIQDETPDYMPVLISANFNPALLAPGKFDGRDNTPLPIGPKSGAMRSMFSDQAIVVVRKSGAAEVIKKQYLTLSVLYRNQSFDNTQYDRQIKWLTPTGVVTPVGRR